MIAKGTTHNNGVKLAQYMTTGKDGERAELWQLYGFAATSIKDAFRDVHIMAEATKCEHPFFHVQVRNREGETLTRQQWETTAQRIMRINGLTGQPYAIAFHINELTGEEHMHLAVSTIDAETLKAKPLPFFKDRLKKISRELEKEFGLQPVKNERDSPIKYAPTRAQEEQARRLGVDIHEVRDTIRNCWDRSDNGRSFRDALEHEGLILAAGDQRGLVVIDHGGGIHALGKRILDMTPGQIKARMSDLARDELPGVAEARAFVVELSAERAQREKPEPIWDREQATVRDEIQWQEALHKAAIAKEKTERRFVEPERHAPAGPARPPQTQGPPKEETRAGHEHAPSQAINNREDFFALGTVAAATREAQRRDQLHKQQAERQRERAPAHSGSDKSELWMAQRGGYEALSPESKTKAEQAFDHWKNHGRGRGTSHNIDAYVSYVQERWKERPVNSREAAGTGEARFLNTIGRDLKAPVAKAINVIVKAAPHRAAGKIFEAFANAAESLLAPTLTPKQIRDAEKAKDRREAEADFTIDFSRVTAEAAQQRQQQENEREAARERPREHERQR